MIIKCKMCGGDVEFTPGATYGTCEYCGSTSTIPKADSEQSVNRYNRANHFRRQCEFDKAVATYEKILEQDETDAEAHWGAVLSRYGIEYVEDPATKKRIPTCHRVQVTSILADADYQAAVENAPDEESRRLYKEEAARIAAIQKEILAISSNEKPYDVFICYKETDENAQRTRDSQWAQDVYYGLTEQGYKVFFSRITLEDKLGQQYEPYIFAALNSAKVMVVIGSKSEYFNAVWVKNEWSRYLVLMKNDRKRLLIPCYRGMDPYDLPEELSGLQSQDMGRIGFMQDLLRGVRKVLAGDTAKKTTVQPVVQQPSASGIEPLLKRAYMFLEDGNWSEATNYCEKVLDRDPENAQAYFGKLLAKGKVHREKSIVNLRIRIDGDPDYRKAVRFASPEEKKVYEGYARAILDGIEYDRREAIYQNARTRKNSVNDEAEFLEVAELFASIRGHKDSETQESECHKKAEAAREAVLQWKYDYAVGILNDKNSNMPELQNALGTLKSLVNWKDCRAKIEECERKLEEKAEAARKAAEEVRIAAKAAAKKEKRIKMTITGIAVAILVFIALFLIVIKPMMV